MFLPNFKKYENVYNCANKINIFHEDFPKRVPISVKLIFYVTWSFKSHITEDMLNHVHSRVMWDLDSEEKGKYRTFDVVVNGNDNVSKPENIHRYMELLHPYTVQDEDSLIYWYKKFQEIHPYIDGNGRVGGIIVAGISKSLFGYYLTPLQ